LHLDEPNCAVKGALDTNEIAWSRYKSYVQMITGEEENYRTDIYGEKK
jgi:ribosome biogenesis GTPase